MRTGEEAANWRSRRWRRPASRPTGELITLRPLPADRLDPRPAEQIIFRRRSTRNYDTEVEIPFDNAPNPHAILVQNFVNAILDAEPLIAPGEEGIHSVELANVILYSSLIGETIVMPMDSAAYEKKLNQLIAGSKVEKKVVEVSNEDFTKSFNR